MLIHHIGIWTINLERQKEFWLKYFQCTASEKYVNEKKQFSSYFIRFAGGTSIELMHRNDISVIETSLKVGFAHIAINLDTQSAVDELTSLLEADGYGVEVRPRITGDGYYESVILDPENNRIELVAQ